MRQRLAKSQMKRAGLTSGDTPSGFATPILWRSVPAIVQLASGPRIELGQPMSRHFELLLRVGGEQAFNISNTELLWWRPRRTLTPHSVLEVVLKLHPFCTYASQSTLAGGVTDERDRRAVARHT